METRPGRRAVSAVSLAAVLAATCFTMVAGSALKAPCASGNWGDGRQDKALCYSDIVALYGTEHLQGPRVPFFNECPADSTCDEYPVLTMFFMRAAAWVARWFSTSYTAFFAVNALGLAALTLFVSWALYRMVGARALYFALAPTLAVYGFMNWDMLAVALATAGTLAYFRGRDAPSGVWLGLGAAAKAYPALLVPPLALDRIRHGNRRAAGHLVLFAVGAWLVVNLPVAFPAFGPWKTFFRFNSSRGADWDSLWFVACQRIHGGQFCPWAPGVLNVSSLVLFVVLAAVVWWARGLVRPDFPAWTFGFPLIVLFLLTNKVYSPQYGLWLLPWFALALPRLPLFLAFEAADVGVFVTRFWFFGRLSAEGGDPAFAGFHGVPLGAFEIAVVIRAAILVACVVAWVVRDAPPLVPDLEARRERPAEAVERAT